MMTVVINDDGSGDDDDDDADDHDDDDDDDSYYYDDTCVWTPNRSFFLICIAQLCYAICVVHSLLCLRLHIAD